MDLEVVKINDQTDNSDEEFFKKMDSKLMLNINKKEIVENDEWIDMVLFTMPYIEKALRNPNKNIITEEEVVKIEQIKKVTVESIKHLSKNTNFISEWDQDTGDVIPSKILNAFKEENYVTYENRFIYSLINLIGDFMFVRQRARESNEFKGKNYTKANYEGNTKIRKEKIKFTFEYYSEIVESEGSNNINGKLSNIMKNLKMLKMTDTYKLLESKRATLVKGTLKMTNVLLKNVNFQYAVKLWNYLNDNFEIKNKTSKSTSEYEEKGLAKKLIDETLYLDFLVLSQITSQFQKKTKKGKTVEDKKERKELIDKLIDKIVEISPEMLEQDLKKMVTDRFIEYRNRDVVSLKPIEKKFKDKISKYITKVEKLRIS